MTSTNQVELISYSGTDLTVVNAARVSYDAESVSLGTSGDGDIQVPTLHYADEKLIKYLAKHKHYSPFGHCFVSFRISCPIFVARQLSKHSFLRINEISRRYIKTDPEVFYPHWRSAIKDKKQGSGDPTDYATQSVATAAYDLSMALSVKTYRQLLKIGICEEQARACLPLASITKFIWSGSLDAMAKMCLLRCAPDTQEETRVIANQISKVMGKIYPHSWNALMGIEWKTTHWEKV